jgi:hypothetical protein
LEVARAISVLGDGAEITVVADFAELEAPAVAAATRELVRAEILRPEPPLGFVHSLVGAAVYSDLAPGERELRHERAAALHELPAELDDLARNLEAVELLALFFGAESRGDQRERLRAHREIDVSAGIGARALAAVAAWNWAEQAGPADSVCALARAALDGGALLAVDGLMTMVATVPLALADLDEAVDAWDAHRAEAHRQGNVFRLAGVQQWDGYTRYLRGELGEAESELRASLATLKLWGMPLQLEWTSPLLTEVLLERGEIGEARAVLDNAGIPPGASDHAILLDRARMRLLLAEGRAADALAYADVYELHAGVKRHLRHLPWRSLKVQALDRLGRRDEAVALAGEELEIARGWGSPGTVGRSLRVLGRSCVRTESSSWRSHAPCSSGRTHGSSTRRHSPHSGWRSGACANRPRRASPYDWRSSWRTFAPPNPWRTPYGLRFTPLAHARARLPFTACSH